MSKQLSALEWLHVENQQAVKEFYKAEAVLNGVGVEVVGTRVVAGEHGLVQMYRVSNVETDSPQEAAKMATAMIEAKAKARVADQARRMGEAAARSASSRAATGSDPFGDLFR